MAVVALQAPASSDSDAELVQRVAAGDVLAFEPIMRRYNRMLFRAARAILRDDAEAEDCLQSAWLLAYRSLGTFAGRSKLSTWLARIVINEALQRRRQAARRDAVLQFGDGGGDDPPSDAAMAAIVANPSPEREAMRHQLRTLIERRIDEMPDVFRGVFVLRAIEELSVEETAALLDIPEATVRTRFFRARSLLREALSREIDHAFDRAFDFDGERCDRLVANVLARLDKGESQ